MNVLTKEAKEKVEKYLKENECAIGVFVAFDAVATPGAPLFEEERDVMTFGQLAEVHHPLFLHRSSLRATLATHYHPVDTRQVHITKVFQQRLTRQETDGCPPDITKAFYTADGLFTFYRHA